MGITAVLMGTAVVALAIYDGSTPGFKVPVAAYRAMGAVAAAFGVIATAAGAAMAHRKKRAGDQVGERGS